MSFSSCISVGTFGGLKKHKVSVSMQFHQKNCYGGNLMTIENRATS